MEHLCKVKSGTNVSARTKTLGSRQIYKHIATNYHSHTVTNSLYIYLYFSRDWLNVHIRSTSIVKIAAITMNVTRVANP